MANGLQSLNGFTSLDYDPAWDTDPWCNVFRQELTKRWPRGFDGHSQPEDILDRIFFRELFAEHEQAYAYSGWWLTNISGDLADEPPPWADVNWEDGEY